MMHRLNTSNFTGGNRLSFATLNVGLETTVLYIIEVEVRPAAAAAPPARRRREQASPFRRSLAREAGGRRHSVGLYRSER